MWLIVMIAMLESQIALKLLTNSILFLSSKRIAKVIKKANIKSNQILRIN